MANQEEANYLLNYHAMSDTFDKVDLPQLKKHVAEAGALAFGLANAMERTGPRLSTPRSKRPSAKPISDEQMKTLESGAIGKAASGEGIK